MLTPDELIDTLNIRRSILNSKEKIMKKKNSEIESRLFNKTQYYVIAIGAKPSMTDPVSKIRAYIYYNGYICFYSTQGRAYNQTEYINYIDFVKKAVESKRFEWADFWINKGQVITRDRANNIHVDNELVIPISSKTRRIVGNISEISLKLYYEFLCTINKDDPNKLAALESAFQKGLLKEKVERIVKNSDSKQLLRKDGEIIVRTNIEGYNYITSYVRTTLRSNIDNTMEIINNFFSRVFYLEMYGYIGVETE